MGDRAGDWQCPNTQCFNHVRLVFGSKSHCPKCGVARDGSALQAPMGMGQQSGMAMPGRLPDWQCPDPSCINHSKMVFGSKTNCPKCGLARDGEMGACMGQMDQMGQTGQMPGQHDGEMGACMGQMGQSGQMSGQHDGEMGACMGQMGQSGQMPSQYDGEMAAFMQMMGQAGQMPGQHHGEMAAFMGQMGQAGQMPGQFGRSPRPTDWQCPNTSCVNHEKMVFGSKATCPRCGSSREGEMMMQPEMTDGMIGRDTSTGGAMMGGMRSTNGNPGDWRCPTINCINSSNMVFARHASCPKCGLEKPSNPQTAGMEAMGGAMTMGGMMGGMMGSTDGSPEAMDMMGGMMGSTDGNSENPEMFGMLGSMMGGTDGNPGRGRGGAMMGGMGSTNGNPGDWRCPTINCINSSNMVFARHANCPKCGLEKPANPQTAGMEAMGGVMTMGGMMEGTMGGMMGGKPEMVGMGAMGMLGGLMGARSGIGGSNPDDWRCPNQECINHRRMVFARHASCQKCGMSKPVAGLEEMYGTSVDDRGRSRSPHRMTLMTQFG